LLDGLQTLLSQRAAAPAAEAASNGKSCETSLRA
jgi:hypothetical protein